MIIVSLLVSIYYNMIIAWCLLYMFESFRKDVPWKTCDNDWNTKLCAYVLSYQSINQSIIQGPNIGLAGCRIRVNIIEGWELDLLSLKNGLRESFQWYLLGVKLSSHWSPLGGFTQIFRRASPTFVCGRTSPPPPPSVISVCPVCPLVCLSVCLPTYLPSCLPASPIVCLTMCLNATSVYICYRTFTFFCRQIRVNATSIDCAALGFAADCKSTSPSEEFFK